MKTIENNNSYKAIKHIIYALTLMIALPGHAMEFNLNQFENTNPDSIIEVGLFSVDNHLLLKGKINGKNAYFLLDTGASYTVLHSKYAKRYQYQVYQAQNSRRKSTGVNASSKHKINTAIDVDLYLGQPTMIQAYFTQNLSALNEHIYQISKIRIAGVIGSDILRTYGCIVDIRNYMLVFLK